MKMTLLKYRRKITGEADYDRPVSWTICGTVEEVRKRWREEQNENDLVKFSPVIVADFTE